MNSPYCGDCVDVVYLGRMKMRTSANSSRDFGVGRSGVSPSFEIALRFLPTDPAPTKKKGQGKILAPFSEDSNA